MNAISLQSGKQRREDEHSLWSAWASFLQPHSETPIAHMHDDEWWWVLKYGGAKKAHIKQFFGLISVCLSDAFSSAADPLGPLLVEPGLHPPAAGSSRCVLLYVCSCVQKGELFNMLESRRPPIDEADPSKALIDGHL